MHVLNRYHRVALRCGAIPLLAGSGIFVLWLMTNWAWLVLAGLATVIIGIPTVLIGSVALAQSCRLALRDAAVPRPRVWRSALAGAGLLLINVPVAAGIIATAMTITARYSVVVYNRSAVRLDDVRVVGCGCDVAYGTLLPGATARHSFPIRQRGNLKIGALEGNSRLDQTIEPYVSSGSGGHLRVTVDRERRIAVDRGTPGFEMFKRVLEMIFQLDRSPCGVSTRTT